VTPLNLKGHDRVPSPFESVPTAGLAGMAHGGWGISRRQRTIHTTAWPSGVAGAALPRGAWSVVRGTAVGLCVLRRFAPMGLWHTCCCSLVVRASS
jgi:hypothetical protein